MPASAAVLRNLTTRQDLNYPSEAEVSAALDKSKGNVRDAVDRLRKAAEKQPRRTSSPAAPPPSAEGSGAPTTPTKARAEDRADRASAQTFTAPFPWYEAQRKAAVTTGYRPSGEQVGSLAAGDAVQVAEIRTGVTGARRARCLPPAAGWGGAEFGWVALALANGAVLLQPRPQPA
eukprot:COSAG04_NODE_11338_length_715_cov_1.224026_1_plen_175_part_10